MKHCTPYVRYGLVILAVAAATLLRVALHGLFGEGFGFITFYPAVALIALTLGAGAGVIATVLSAVAANYFCMEPLHTLAIDTPAQALGLALFTPAGLVISLMAGQLDSVRRKQAQAVERQHSQEQLLQAAAETERQRQLLAVTLGSIGDGVIVTDVQGRVTFLNGEAERLTGWTSQEAAGRPLATVFNIINEQTRQPVENPAEKVLRLGTAVGLANHTILVAKDGREIPIDDSGAPIRQADGRVEGVVLVFRDFSDRRTAEESLYRAKVEWERTFDAVPDLIAVLDREHRIVRTNKAMAQALGTAPDAAIGRKCYECVHGTDGPPADCPHVKSMADGREHVEEIHEPQLNMDLLVSTTPVRDEHGNVVGSVHVARDITERKAAEEALRRSEQRVRAKLESILSPEGDLGKLELGDILDIDALQKLMNSFHELAQIPMAIIDLKGKMLVGVGWQDICTKFHRINPETCKHCIESDTVLAGTAARGEFKLYKCRNNMWDMATPIIVGGQHVGNLFLGQFFFEGEELPYEQFRLQARRYGFNETDYLAALERVPRLSRKTVDMAVDFFLRLSQTLSQLSYSNVKLAKLLAERDRREQDLRQMNRTLKALGSSDQAMLRARDETSYIQQVCRIIVEECGHAMVWVGYAEQDEDKGIRPVACAGFEAGYLETLRLTWADTERGRGPTGTAMRTGKPYLCRNMLTDPRFEPWRQDAVKRGYASSIALPLMDGDSCAFGALTIYCRDPDPFTQEEVRLLSDLAADLAYGITAIRLRQANAQAEQELRENDERLRQLNETLERRVAERTDEAQQRAEQLRALAAQLTQAEQRERQRLAAILHDHLQQLLVGMKFQLGMLRTQWNDPKLVESVGEIDSLLDQSLETSRSLTVDLSPPILIHGNMAQVLRWLAEWMQSKHGLEVSILADEEANPQAYEVRVLLFQATRELLFNIVKHAQVQDATVELCQLNEQQVRVVVRDRGEGFDSSNMQMQSSKGSGFGLLAIRERLNWLGGTFQIDSRPGHGTRATLTAPMVLPKKADSSSLLPGAAHTPGTTSLHTPPAVPAGQRIRVLLADDHTVVRDGLDGLLQRLPDVEVVGKAADGRQAVQMALELKPDIVVMDVSMPVLDGVEATRQIKAKMPQTEIIGLSMFDEEGMADDMKMAGAVHYLPKTLGPGAIIEAIRQHGRS